MSKLTLTALPDPTVDPEGFVTAYNNNLTAIEAAFDITLSRDGTEPNEVETDVDLGGKAVINGPYTPPPPEYLTSKLYALIFENDWARANALPIIGSYYPIFEDEGRVVSVSLMDGGMIAPLQFISFGTDEFGMMGTQVLGGNLESPVPPNLIDFEWGDNEFEMVSATILSGTIEEPLVIYEWPPQLAEQHLPILTGGSLV